MTTRNRGREWRNKLRSAALDAYGRACACCGETIERFLTIDHAANDGNVHRQRLGGSSSYVNRWLRDNEYPEGFQTLCSNCNAGRHVNGGECPHVAPVKEPRTKGQRSDRKLKTAVINAYGGRCACCEESLLPLLCIDHIGGGGIQHRKSLGVSGGAGFNRWLRDQGFPSGFQVLCWNCNDGKSWNGGTCPHLG
ncbi:hypothetical protein AB0N37_22185 [Streptomyces griseoincarnatus]